MATGEVVDAEALGGARVHASVTGLADQIATDEFVSSFGANYRGVLCRNTSDRDRGLFGLINIKAGELVFPRRYS